MKAIFPDIYPEDLLSRIIEDGAGENVIEPAYRIAIYGYNNRDAFLSTLLTNIKDEENKHNNRDAYLATLSGQTNIDIYSTSLFENEKYIRKLMSVMEKRYGGPILLKGTITPEFGLNMFTRDSKTRRRGNKSHIDWWLYKDADPSPFFYQIIIEEE